MPCSGLGCCYSGTLGRGWSAPLAQFPPQRTRHIHNECHRTDGLIMSCLLTASRDYGPSSALSWAFESAPRITLRPQLGSLAMIRAKPGEPFVWPIETRFATFDIDVAHGPLLRQQCRPGVDKTRAIARLWVSLKTNGAFSSASNMSSLASSSNLATMNPLRQIAPSV